MKRFIGFIIIIIVSIGAAFAVKAFLFSANTQNSSNTDSDPTLAAPTTDDIVREKMSTMTLDEKIAQMLIPERTTPTTTPEELTTLTTTPYSGYILMGGAYSTLAETRATVESLQASAKTPLIITTDQEGGLVQRLKSITYPSATDIPDMYSVGETGNLIYAKTIGRVLAEELRAVGINVDLAPDADVFSNPDNTVIGRRSFSSDAKTVANMSQALASGLEENGVTATFKHFPGHGDTATDSHEDLPIINRTREELDNCDFVPFKNAIKNGAEFIMVGHIAMPALSGDYVPASLSPQITTNLLRQEFGFENLIITDGLDMGALSDHYTEEEIYQKTVEAGADLLLMPPNPELAASVIKAQIPESRIDESVFRILKFKQTHLTDYQYLDFSYFGSDEHFSAVNPQN